MRRSLFPLILVTLLPGCGDTATAPPPVGNIAGRVTVEGEGVNGVSVALSSGASSTTANGGHYRFLDVEGGGPVTITISGFPADANFDMTSADVTITSGGQTVTRDFAGTYIRTSQLMGLVTGEGRGIPGITVTLSGRREALTVTDGHGQYTFGGLRAGDYSVAISGFDPMDVVFRSTMTAVSLTVGDSKVWSVDGTYVRESTIKGDVSVESDGLAEVVVTLQGMSTGLTHTTGDDGLFVFERLRAGTYQVDISGYDADDYAFVSTSRDVTLAPRETEHVPFRGSLRTSSIMGHVSVGDAGIGGVTVTLQGMGIDESRVTSQEGAFFFLNLADGDYRVAISFDTVAYRFPTTFKPVRAPRGRGTRADFFGEHAGKIYGKILADLTHEPLQGAVARIVVGGNSCFGEATANCGPVLTDTTGTDGVFSFTSLEINRTYGANFRYRNTGKGKRYALTRDEREIELTIWFDPS